MSLERARNIVADVLIRNGTAEANARAVARALVLAEADGQDGHGVARLSSYVAQVRSGKVDGAAVPTVSQTAPGVVVIDAGLGFAYPALELAVASLVPLARAQGVAVAAVRRSHHCGALGLVVEQLADAGLIGLMVANTPSAMAPWGARRALFGTNPIACAIPAPGRPPVIVDLALSRVARGHILAAKQRGEAIPPGWALDADGNPTTDATAALAGTMLPLGDAKGSALALMVELLAAGLTGSNYALQASSFLDAEGEPPGTGQLLIALAPETVRGRRPGPSRRAVRRDRRRTGSPLAG